MAPKETLLNIKFKQIISNQEQGKTSIYPGGIHDRESDIYIGLTDKHR